MTRLASKAGFGLIAVTAAAAALAFVVFGGGSSTTASAQGNGPNGAQAAAKDPNATIAVAIGTLTEDSGDTATVDLHAHTANGITAGNLRFFSDEYGYYNGGVKSLTVSGGVITVQGGGGLFPPGGPRVQVHYTATFDSNTGQAQIAVQGRNVSYTMSGHVDGLIWSGHPGDKMPAAAPAATS